MRQHPSPRRSQTSPRLHPYPLSGEIPAQPKLTRMQRRSQPFRTASSSSVSITASKIYSNQNARIYSNRIDAKFYSNRVAFNYHGISRRYPPLLIFLARRTGSRVTHMMQSGTMTRKFKIGKFEFSDFRGRQSRLLESGSSSQRSPPTSAPIVPHTPSGMHNLSWHH